MNMCEKGKTERWRCGLAPPTRVNQPVGFLLRVSGMFKAQFHLLTHRFSFCATFNRFHGSHPEMQMERTGDCLVFCSWALWQKTLLLLYRLQENAV